jgi:hypothetical protein
MHQLCCLTKSSPDFVVEQAGKDKGNRKKGKSENKE